MGRIRTNRVQRSSARRGGFALISHSAGCRSFRCYTYAMIARTKTWLSISLLMYIAACSLYAAAPWDQAFAKDAQAIVRAAQAVGSSDAAVVMLLQDHHYSIDARGLMTITERYVYRVIKQEAVESWSTVRQPYEPWYEDRPQLRARVISKDGVVSELAANTIADSPAAEQDSKLFTERRMLKAPLPAVSVGSVVEMESTLRQRQPLLASGVVHRLAIPQYLPIEQYRIRIEADKAVPLRIAARGLPDDAVKQTGTAKGQVVECHLQSLRPLKEIELFVPEDQDKGMSLSFATGSNWQSIAQDYHRIVEQALSSGIPGAWAEEARAKTPGDDRAIIAALVSRLHQQIRYTGVEFGEAAIVPRSPAETMERKYGDCKDKSVLLVGLLRSAGLKANVVLLSAGFGEDVDVGLPGMGTFNHAIVYVDSNPPLWIDATAEHFPVGSIPAADQGRRALIVRPETTELVRTPESTASTNWSRHSVDIRLSDYGFGTVEESVEAGGSQAAELRAAYGGEDERSRKMAEEYVEESYSGKLADFHLDRRGEAGTDFHLRLKATDAKVILTHLDEAAAVFDLTQVFRYLPFTVFVEPRPDATPRGVDLLLPEAHQIEYRYRIHPPLLFRAAALPETVDRSIGGVRFVRSYTVQQDGVVEIVTRIEATQRRIASAELAEFSAAIRTQMDRAIESLTFVPETQELVALGKTAEALDMATKAVNASPESAAARIHRSRVLLSLGLGLPARYEAHKATELAPTLGAAWLARGLAYQANSLGKPFTTDWSREEAERSFRRARELDKEDDLATVSLAQLLEYNSSGSRYGSGSSVEESIELYRALVKEGNHPIASENLPEALFYSRQFDAALDALKQSGSKPSLSFDLMVTCAKKGPAAVLTDPRLGSLDVQGRASTLVQVALSQISLRSYQQAGVILNAVVRLTRASDVQGLADFLTPLRPYEQAVAPRTDPRYPVQQLIIHSVNGTLDAAALNTVLSSRLRSEADLAAFDLAVELRSSVRNSLGGLDFSGARLLDFFVGTDREVAGEEPYGYVVQAALPRNRSFFVIKEDGEYRILGTSAKTAAVGAHLLDLVNEKNIVAAQWWLDHLLSAVNPLDGNSTMPAMQSFWSGVGEARRGPGPIRLAAASLMGAYEASPRSLEIFRAERLKATTPYDRNMIDIGIAESLASAEQWKELLPVARRLANTKAYAQRGLKFAERIAESSSNWNELEGIAARYLLDDKTNNTAIELVSMARARSGDTRAALEWANKLETRAIWGWDPLLLETWVSIYGNVASDALVQRFLAHSDVKTMGATNADVQFTLAVLQLNMGNLGASIQTLDRAANLERSAVPTARIWLAYSLLCKKLGFPEAAEDAWRFAQSADRRQPFVGWVFSLAERDREAKTQTNTP